MDSNAWFILIYLTTDADSQARLVAELQALGRLTIQTERRDQERLVVIEGDGGLAPLTVHELVVLVDPHAELIYTHDGSQPATAESIERRRRIAANRRTVSLTRRPVSMD